MHGGGAPLKFGAGPGHCSVRDSRYSLVRGGKGWELYGMEKDIGQKQDIAAKHPEIVKKMSVAYDEWWRKVRPNLVNEDSFKTAPKTNPFKEAYKRQFGGDM